MKLNYDDDETLSKFAFIFNSRRYNEAAVQALLAAGAEVDKASDGGRTPLWIAAVRVRAAVAGAYTRPLLSST